MKGQKKVSIGEKEVTLRFDLNALSAFCDELEVGLSELDAKLDVPSNIIFFIQCLAESGGSKVSKDEIGKLGFDELSNIFDLVKESAGKIQAPKKGAKD